MAIVLALHFGSLVLYLLSFLYYWRFFVTKHSGRTATLILLAGLTVHSVMLVLYTAQRNILPLGQFALAATSFVWLFGLFYFIQEFLLREQEFGVFVTAILSIVQTISILTVDYSRPLADILQNVMFEVHVAFMLFAYASFALGFIAALMYVILFKEIQGHRFGLFYSRLPSLEFLDKLNLRSVLIGLAFLTIGIGFGMLNAGEAWGFFWEWDPKLTVVFINWVIYLVLGISHLLLNWRGQRTSLLSILGFLMVVFSFFIVTNFASTIHTF
ncbi:MAG TPA: cytochrome c biogenesis protein CcsA [bacterium]|nr:cytochrome c biogenesis protein CcsA [bacterium]